MKKIQLNFKSIVLITVLAVIIAGCTERMETPVKLDDATILYPAKKTDDVSATITLCSDVDKKTDERLGVGTVFTAREGANVRAFIDLENRFVRNDFDLMFHIEWKKPDGTSFYMKRVDLLHNDSSTSINSSISISPDLREPGEYTICLYYFRELMAEKKFEILPKFELFTKTGERLKANITLYRKTSKKTGKLIGEGTSFKIKDNENVRASIDLENRFVYGRHELSFMLDWIGPDGKSFYQKQIDLYPNDSTTSFNSAISISPGKREAGKYSLRLYLFDELVSEKEFELHQ